MEIFAGIIIKHCGVFVRWAFQAIAGNITGTKIKTFKQLYSRTDRDPSNRMSDGLIDVFLGIGLIGFVSFILLIFI